MIQNKKLLAGIGIVVLVAVVVGGFFVLSSNKSSTKDESKKQEQILILSAEEIGLSLEMGEEGKEVTMLVDNVEGITSIEYELSYISKGDIPRGAIGSVEVTGESIEKKITLGTCSDRCHYDEEVRDIKIILKVIKSDGKIYQVEKSLEE